MVRGMYSSKYAGLGVALAVSIGVSLVLFLARVMASGSTRYWFLFWNLLLAFVPLIVAAILLVRIRKTKWRRPLNLFLTFIWLIFLPNSFYLVTDLIHLHDTGQVSLLFDAVFFMSVIFNGLALGFISLTLIHRALLTRTGWIKAHLSVAGVLLACSYAIYLGRVWRWNSWDVVANPAGVLFDVSDQFINSDLQLGMIFTTGYIFMLLSSMYLVVWSIARTARD